MIVPALLALIPPALPPSGPVAGRFECLFEADEGKVSAEFSFDESSPTYGNVPSGSAIQDTQARFRQFPVDGNRLSHVEFEADDTISVHEMGGRLAGRFVRLASSLTDDGQWRQFMVPDAAGKMTAAGLCFGHVRGRAERPVRLTKIATFRVDRTDP